MKDNPRQLSLPGFEPAQSDWQAAYDAAVPQGPVKRNRSGIEVKPLYTPQDWDGAEYMTELGFPGQSPMTRGIYPSMYRGRTWSQRQLIGLGTPEDYNARLKKILAAGATAVSLIPCNSVYRGYDADEVDIELLGTCGTTVNTVDDMDTCLRDVPIERISTGLNDPLPFTLLAQVLAVAKRRNIGWDKIAGTSNQSDYLSHFIANHMFYRLSLPGSRRVLLDHIDFANRHLPKWNPLSVVGQHMQQAGAHPAQAMGLTISSAIQYAEDMLARGADPDAFLPRFTFFFDISISFFEEVAKLRAGRRIWAEIVRERLGAKTIRATHFKFHSQTSGVDLTRQQPLNNIARTTVQALAAIFGGTQSLHTDAYDEVLSVPTEEAAQIAVATQNILREEAHVTEVIDPLGGSYYMEALTNRMEGEIRAVIAQIDAAGGMYRAAESGLVQDMIGESALDFQDRVDRGEEKIIGVNSYQVEEPADTRRPLERPARAAMEAQVAKLKAYKRDRNQQDLRSGLDALARAACSESENTFAAVVEATIAGATHGEICACLRRELGFGYPLVAA